VTPLVRMLADDSGVTAVQYALIAALLSVVMIGALTKITAVCSTRLATTSTNLTLLGSAPP
jgi:Flp pilus assembly pilin Flp